MSKADFVLRLIDRVTAPARAMSRALGGMREAQKAVTQASTAAQSAVANMGDATAKAGVKAAKAAVGVDSLAKAQLRLGRAASSAGRMPVTSSLAELASMKMSLAKRAQMSVRGLGGGNLINTNYTKSGISGASSSLKGPAAMQGPVLNRSAQKLGIGARLGLAIKPIADWNAATGEAIGKWRALGDEFMSTPFGMAAGGLGGIALGAAGLAKDVALAAIKVAALTLALGGLAAVGLTKMVVEMGAFAERSKRAMTFLNGGNKAIGKEAFESGRALAKEFNLDVEETVQQLIKLRAMQFSMPEAVELTKLSADLQAISGDAEAASRALTAITQIKAKGKLQSEELVGQLAEAGVSTVLVYEQLEKSLGKSRKQVLAALQDGAIDAETGIAAIKAAILHKIGINEAGAAGKAFAQETLTGMWQGLTNAPKQLALDISEFVDTSPITKSIGKLMDAFAGVDRASVGDFVTSMISGLSKALDAVIAFGDGFGSGFEEIRRVMGISLDTGSVTGFAREAGRWLADFFAKSIGWGKVLFKTIQDIWPVLETMWILAKPVLDAMLKTVLSIASAFDGAYKSAKFLYDLLPGADIGKPPPLPAQGGATPVSDRFLGRSEGSKSSSVTVSRIDVSVDASGNDPNKVAEKTKDGLMGAFSTLGIGRAL